jgi:hypothetical protein
MTRLQNAEKQLHDALLALESAANALRAQQQRRDEGAADSAALGAEIAAIETRLAAAIALIDGATAAPSGVEGSK